MTLTPEEQAAAAAVASAPVAPPAQDPAVASAPAPTQPPVAAPSAPPQASQGPWSADLAEAFPDEAVRSQVDAYLREKVQPHVTRIEQAAKPAQELYKAFQDEPRGTFVQIATELYGEDEAKAIAEYLTALDEGDPFAAEPADAQPPATTQATRDPEVQALIDADRTRKEELQFKAEFARVAALNSDIALDYDLFVPFVAKAGNFDQAVTAYREHAAAFAAKHAPVPEGGEPVAATAPPVLGSGTAAGATAPPTQESYANLDEAVDAFFEEQRAAKQSLAPPIPAG